MLKNVRLAVKFRRCVSAMLCLILALGLVGCGSKSSGEALRAPDGKKISTVTIETVYGDLAFPKELKDHMRHEEVVEGNLAVELFYMVSSESEKELYRIYYGDANQGTLVGYLTTDSGDVSVSCAVNEYEDEAFKDEEERKLYYEMMGAFTVLVNSIYADQRYTENGTVEPVQDQKQKLRYWNVVLPENVLFEESESGDVYRVDFYGELGGQRINLFMIALGEVEAESTLGFYEVNGVPKPIKVQTCDLSEYAYWPQADQDAIYQMMGSLNTVVQAILSDKNYSEMENQK